MPPAGRGSDARTGPCRPRLPARQYCTVDGRPAWVPPTSAGPLRCQSRWRTRTARYACVASGRCASTSCCIQRRHMYVAPAVDTRARAAAQVPASASACGGQGPHAPPPCPRRRGSSRRRSASSCECGGRRRASPSGCGARCWCRPCPTATTHTRSARPGMRDGGRRARARRGGVVCCTGVGGRDGLERWIAIDTVVARLCWRKRQGRDSGARCVPVSTSRPCRAVLSLHLLLLFLSSFSLTRSNTRDPSFPHHHTPHPCCGPCVDPATPSPSYLRPSASHLRPPCKAAHRPSRHQRGAPWDLSWSSPTMKGAWDQVGRPLHGPPPP